MALPLTIFSRFVIPYYLTACHNILTSHMQATIVTANGTALTVSDSENADLFWAIRGGGSNFGVCTEFVLRLHPQRRTVFAGNVIFPATVLDDMMKVLSEWWNTITDHEGILQTLFRDPAGSVSDGYLVNNSAEQLKNAFAGLHHAFHVL
jgi:FAD/FMN-containing dehydrogenase